MGEGLGWGIGDIPSNHWGPKAGRGILPPPFPPSTTLPCAVKCPSLLGGICDVISLRNCLREVGIPPSDEIML